MSRSLTSSKMPGSSVAESLPIEAPSTHHKFSHDLLESERELIREVWPDSQTANSGRIPPKGATTNELTAWIRNHNFTIPVRLPSKNEFVHVGGGYRALSLDFWTIMDDAGDVYRVSHDLIYETRAQFVHLYGAMSFALTMSSSGSMFLWPVMSRSLRKSLREKKCLWVRVSFDGASEPRLLDLPQGEFPEPIFPDLNLGDIIDMGFQSRVIESLRHPLIKRLHGNVIVFPSVSNASS